MTKRIGVAATAAIFSAVTLLAVTYDGRASARSGLAASDTARQALAGDVGAGRHHRHHDVYRSAYTSYLGRPYYYAPAPFFPIPPLFGYGWEPY